MQPHRLLSSSRSKQAIGLGIILNVSIVAGYLLWYEMLHARLGLRGISPRTAWVMMLGCTALAFAVLSIAADALVLVWMAVRSRFVPRRRFVVVCTDPPPGGRLWRSDIWLDNAGSILDWVRALRSRWDA